MLNVFTDAHLEVVEAVDVDVLQLVSDCECVFDDGKDMLTVSEVCLLRQTRRSHVGGASCLYLLDALKSFLAENLLVK